MEQARCWMWPKRKLDLMPASHQHHHHHLLTYQTKSVSDSWEEQAFAEDAAGALGGCVWPPRSYTCSFCRREFRSAQALGGHMNVHRRDRARLKQSSPSAADGEGGAPNPAANTTVPLESQYGGGGGSTFLYNRSSDSDHWTRVSTSIQEQYKVEPQSRGSPIPYRTVGGHKNNGLSAWSNLSAASRSFRLTPDVKNGDEKKEIKVMIDEAENNLKILDSSCSTRTTTDEDVPSCKRRKIDTNPPFGLFPKPGSDILSNPIEELDLELRLGDPPK